MLNRKAAVIEDIYQDERIPHDAYRPTFVKSLAMVPIRTMDPIGAIGNYWARNRMPSVEQVTLLQSLADITAVSFENITIHNELEQRVKDRTAALEASHIKLEEANRELESFSYSVSHDLRAPLRAIVGYSNTLLEERASMLDESGKNCVGIILKNANRMNLLIEDLLRFSRLMQRGLEVVDVDSTTIVGEVIRNLIESGERSEKFIIHPLAPVRADLSLLIQVWTNLISNAVKYSSKKPMPRIEVGCYESDGASVFFVKDNGTGFDMNYSDKLFGVFQRLHSVAEFEGTGIGLALVKRILVRHGGRVWAEAKVDEGATFYFSIPN